MFVVACLFLKQVLFIQIKGVSLCTSEMNLRLLLGTHSYCCWHVGCQMSGIFLTRSLRRNLLKFHNQS